ncbi:hypothetical protein CMK20_11390 [Candidatus Poribacteria bacterium]|nr:hypothetical protein [Candidatus Poribacteria bacterium]MBF74783.1 hypothetical protein [Candidatus Poribacteria bacterium]MBP94518.1 hypothetical protein [Candidatus Poribacteria bacterium]
MKSKNMWNNLGEDSIQRIQADRDWIVGDMVRRQLSLNKVLEVFSNDLKPEIVKLYKKHSNNMR